ncbi:hypothetical protein [Nocardia mexicana]|uniref:Uncharacterized protein n=1 Tax=Nocardia mexicana TaxID=279262 RepID=A0A370GMZ8_9NOCA|nr:hypothetical protein [Nocardia mexicana]RDI45105.1 hypothetical protein DFR68_114126 [Nocardia mexicana]
MPFSNGVTSGRDIRGPGSAAPRRIRHIRIETGAFALDYQACAEQIADIVAELGANAGIVVTVDDDVRPDLPPLPCAALWD